MANKIKCIYMIIIMMLPLISGASEKNDSINILRPVNSAYTLNIGNSSILDTYLTPIRYKGLGLRLGYERIQSMKFSPDKWKMQMIAGVSYAGVQNIVKNRTMYSLMIDFSWGMMHRWNIINGLSLYGGGSTSLNGGVIYNQYNSNNPVSVKIRWSMNFTGMVVYNTKLRRLPITLIYQPTLPVAGAFFSPDYGEAFYEIYVGNHSNLAHFGWWGNRFDMINSVTADLHFGNTSLRIGYRGTIESSWINNLNTQIFTNSVIIGISGEWINVSNNSKLGKQTKIISALY